MSSTKSPLTAQAIAKPLSPVAKAVAAHVEALLSPVSVGSVLNAAGAVPGHSEEPERLATYRLVPGKRAEFLGMLTDAEADTADADDGLDPIQDAIDAGLSLEEVFRVAGRHAR